LVILLSPFPLQPTHGYTLFARFTKIFQFVQLISPIITQGWGIMTILHLSSLYYDDDWFVCHLSYVLIVPVKKSLSSS
jgi:hypothetical protein